ncbi:DNA topoisomerase IV [Aurantibacter crassamenti]|uniref:DNA topoisomerase IV n=1 Tax=Aurantibacter crassamenti TaxID=1837375 RepID=UPI00193A3E66|nr:DNA topoisomerase IV [Aurantibacter crassamenti]MBM1106970.1 DNA topoisomerase IV [Aurantibacter crassamenti]
MIRYTLSILVLLVFTSCYQPERNCKDYKNGKFTFDYMIDSVALTGVFTRHDDLSIEYYEGKIDSSTVRWINDCEYIVKKINPKNMAEEKPVHIKILTTTDNSYTFEFSIVGNNKTKSKGTAIKTN